MISLQNVEKVYRTERIETIALSNVNLDVDEGDFVSIMGPSGSGKSTLMNVIGLLDVPTSGRIVLGGREIASYKDKALARIRNQEIGFVFQTFHLIADLSVVDNARSRPVPPPASSERRARALAALDKVGLSARTRHFPSQLSGGQQQRVAIARAIAGAPRLLLADEPTGNLDSQMGDEIIALLQDLNANGGCTVVMVTHDIRQAEKTKRIIRLFDGRQVN